MGKYSHFENGKLVDGTGNKTQTYRPPTHAGHLKPSQMKKMRSVLATTPVVMDVKKQCEQLGFTIEYDKDAGTLIVKDGDLTIYWAIQKGHNAPWIVSYHTEYFG